MLVLMSSVRDEGPFLLEWVAHHLVVGFDRLAVASNDCTDGTDALLDALARVAPLDHVRHVVPEGEAPQHAAYAAIRAAGLLECATWLATLDADEFLNVHAGGHRVGDLTTRAGEADLISLHARTFAGAEGRWSPGAILPRLTGALPQGHKADTMLKSLARDPARFGAFHNHSPVRFLQGRPLRVVEGDGTRREVPPGVPLWQALRSAPVREGIHALAQVNHYATKWADAFALRRARGRGAAAAGGAARHTDAYWAERAGPGPEDRTILRHADATAARMAEMLRDPAVAAAQAACDAAWAARCQAIGWRHDAE